MKQKDKKITKRQKESFSNVVIEDGDYYDDLQSSVTSKAKRTSDKSRLSLKNDLQLKRGRVVEVKSNYLNIVRIGELEYFCSISGRLKQYLFKTKMLSAVGDWVEVDFSHAPDYRIEEILPGTIRYAVFRENPFNGK